VQAGATLDAVGAILLEFLASYSVTEKEKTCPVKSYNAKYTHTHTHSKQFNAHLKDKLH